MAVGRRSSTPTRCTRDGAPTTIGTPAWHAGQVNGASWRPGSRSEGTSHGNRPLAAPRRHVYLRRGQGWRRRHAPVPPPQQREGSPNTDPRAPRAAVLITAAVHIRSSGFTTPLSRDLLTQVHDHYLQERGGSRLQPKPIADAWAWATRDRRATTALLQDGDGEHVQVFDPGTRSAGQAARPGLGSVCVSFTPVRGRSLPTTLAVFAHVANGGGHW